MRGPEHKTSPPPTSWVVRHLQSFSPRWRYLSLKGNLLHCFENEVAKNSITHIGLADCVLQDAGESQIVIKGEIDCLELDFRTESIKRQWIDALRSEVRAVEDCTDVRASRGYQSPPRSQRTTTTSSSSSSSPLRRTGGGFASHSPVRTPTRSASSPTRSSYLASTGFRPTSPRNTHISTDILTTAVKWIKYAYEENVRETAHQKQPSADRASMCAYLADQVLFYLGRLNGDLGSIGNTINDDVHNALYVSKSYHGAPRPIHELDGDWEAIKDAAKRFDTPFWFEQSKSTGERNVGYEAKIRELTEEIIRLQTALREMDERHQRNNSFELEDELKKLQDLLWAEKTKVGELTNGKRELELQLIELKAKLDALQGQLSTAASESSKNNKYEALMKQMDADNQKLYDRMSSSKAEYQELYVKYEANLSLLEKAKKHAADMDKDNQKLFDQLMELKAKLSELQHSGGRGGSDDTALLRYKVELDDFKNNKDDLDAEVERLRKQNAELKAKLSITINTTTSTPSGNDDRMRQLKEDLASSQADNAKLFEALQKLKERCSDLESQKGSGSGDTHNRLELLINQNEKLEDDLKAITHRYDLLLQQGGSGGTSDNGGGNSALEAQNKKLKDELEALKAQLEALRNSRPTAAEIEKMQNQLEELNDLNRKLQFRSEDLEEQNKQMQDSAADSVTKGGKKATRSRGNRVGGGADGDDDDNNPGNTNWCDLVKRATDTLAGSLAIRSRQTDADSLCNYAPSVQNPVKWMNTINSFHPRWQGKVNTLDDATPELLNGYLCLLSVLYPEELSEIESGAIIDNNDMKEKANKIRFTLDKLEISGSYLTTNDMLTDGKKDHHLTVLAVLFDRFCDSSKCKLLGLPTLALQNDKQTPFEDYDGAKSYLETGLSTCRKWRALGEGNTTALIEYLLKRLNSLQANAASGGGGGGSGGGAGGGMDGAAGSVGQTRGGRDLNASPTTTNPGTSPVSDLGPAVDDDPPDDKSRGPTTAQEYLDAAQAKIEVGDHDGADLLYSKGLEQFPDCEQLWFSRGFLRQQMLNMPQEAIADYEKAASLRPDLWNALGQLGDIYVNCNGDGEKAVEVLTKAISNGATDPDVFCNRAEAFAIATDDPDFTKVVGDFKEALKLKPGYERAKRGLSFYKPKMLRQINERVRKKLESALASLPSVSFEQNSSKLDGKDAKQLIAVAKILQEHKEVKLKVIGITTSNKQAGLRLAKERAQSCIHYMTKRCDVEEARLIADGVCGSEKATHFEPVEDAAATVSRKMSLDELDSDDPDRNVAVNKKPAAKVSTKAKQKPKGRT